jgi:hypothetical protein
MPLIFDVQKDDNGELLLSFTGSEIGQVQLQPGFGPDQGMQRVCGTIFGNVKNVTAAIALLEKIGGDIVLLVGENVPKTIEGWGGHDPKCRELLELIAKKSKPSNIANTTITTEIKAVNPLTGSKQVDHSFNADKKQDRRQNLSQGIPGYDIPFTVQRAFSGADSSYNLERMLAYKTEDSKNAANVHVKAVTIFQLVSKVGGSEVEISEVMPIIGEGESIQQWYFEVANEKIAILLASKINKIAQVSASVDRQVPTMVIINNSVPNGKEINVYFRSYFITNRDLLEAASTLKSMAQDESANKFEEYLLEGLGKYSDICTKLLLLEEPLFLLLIKKSGSEKDSFTEQEIANIEILKKSYVEILRTPVLEDELLNEEQSRFSAIVADSYLRELDSTKYAEVQKLAADFIGRQVSRLCALSL